MLNLRRPIDSVSGFLLIISVILVICAEWGGDDRLYLAGGTGIFIAVALLIPTAGLSRQLFVLVGLTLALIAIGTREDWPHLLRPAVQNASFVPAFFLALASLRNAASTSDMMERCGRFLADQPANQRYFALSMGGHLFGIALSYGSISLLGSLAVQGTRHMQDDTLRSNLMKRMLLAVQRGFLAMTAWSPLTFSLAITTSIIAGSSWSGAVGGCIITAVILITLGWIFDVAPSRISKNIEEIKPNLDDTWSVTWPLIILLAMLFAGITAMQILSGVRAVSVALVAVPLISLGWIAAQGWHRRGGPIVYTTERALKYIMIDTPNYRSELVLLIMAAFIGTTASGLLAPFVAGGSNFSIIPGWLVLVMLVWLMPITGQLAMNPILAIHLIAPLLPDATVLGVSPDAIIVALTAGWARSGVSSPYTASTLLLAALGRVTALEAGPKWNGLYTIAGCTILSAWVVIYSYLT